MRFVLAVIGASIKWIFHGFKEGFLNELYGEDTKYKVEEDSSVLIGIIIVVAIVILMAKL